jgi:hypothetical protein
MSSSVLGPAADSAARPGSCRKPPGALYVKSDKERDLLAFALVVRWELTTFLRSGGAPRTTVHVVGPGGCPIGLRMQPRNEKFFPFAGKARTPSSAPPFSRRSSRHASAERRSPNGRPPSFTAALAQIGRHLNRGQRPPAPNDGLVVGGNHDVPHGASSGQIPSIRYHAHLLGQSQMRAGVLLLRSRPASSYERGMTYSADFGYPIAATGHRGLIVSVTTGPSCQATLACRARPVTPLIRQSRIGIREYRVTGRQGMRRQTMVADLSVWCGRRIIRARRIPAGCE